MQKILSSALALLFPILVFCQTPAQRATMRAATNTPALNQLIADLQARRAIEQQEVIAYASQNNVPIFYRTRIQHSKIVIT